MDNRKYEHSHFAHCESGVMSLMMRFHGLPISESMVFGLSGALSFAYLPFIKIGDMPLIAYRSMPRAIIKGLQKNLQIKMKMQTFSSPEKGTEALDILLGQGAIAGVQTCVFWLPYFPEAMRFHFNAHNLIVYGKENDDYLISDPVFEAPVRCESKALEKSRFVKGLMAPKGLIYYPERVPDSIDYARIIPIVIKKTSKMMLKTPVPIAGIRGIRYLAKNIGKLEKKERSYAKLFLGHIVRMQEEIGTGGAGFRFIYASFLQESAKIINNRLLQETSEMMTEVGDQWREFALMLAHAIRRKRSEEIDFASLKTKLNAVADGEAAVYSRLLKGKLS